MNDYNRQSLQNPERPMPDMIGLRLSRTAQAEYILNIAADNTVDVSGRDVFTPRYAAAPAAQAVSNVIEILPKREQSVAADNRMEAPVMPLPSQPAQNDSARIQQARENLDAFYQEAA